MQVSERLRCVIMDSGWNVTDAAKRVGVTRSALSNVINGNAELSIDLAFSLQHQFKVNARELLVAQLNEKILRMGYGQYSKT